MIDVTWSTVEYGHDLSAKGADKKRKNTMHQIRSISRKLVQIVAKYSDGGLGIVNYFAKVAIFSDFLSSTSLIFKLLIIEKITFKVKCQFYTSSRSNVFELFNTSLY